MLYPPVPHCAPLLLFKCLLVRNISNNASLCTDLVDQGLSQLVDSWMGRVILGVGFCSFITSILALAGLFITLSAGTHFLDIDFRRNLRQFSKVFLDLKKVLITTRKDPQNTFFTRGQAHLFYRPPTVEALGSSLFNMEAA